MRRGDHGPDRRYGAGGRTTSGETPAASAGNPHSGARRLRDGAIRRARDHGIAMTTALAPRAAASLRRRDPEFVRRATPLLWPLLRVWFRPEVRGLERIPATGPVLLVGNHSGGNVAPDTLVFTLAFARRFGPGRPFFQLAHDLVLAAPWLRLLRSFGTISADPVVARAALAAGAAVLVYPGGDWEVHRPVWQRNRIDFHDRHGFVRLALETGCRSSPWSPSAARRPRSSSPEAQVWPARCTCTDGCAWTCSPSHWRRRGASTSATRWVTCRCPRS
jgi:1-acyl-sn-glycerol-3-phosphate acyltransferase